MTIYVDELIQAMANNVKTLTDLANTEIIGIQTMGFEVAQRLANCLDFTREIGSLNISFYRDDFTKIGLHPEVTPSNLPFSVEDKNIILVDDVLHTGRTIKAALNEIFDYGRPSKVLLAILVDRKEHELPIKPDVCGMDISISPRQEIKVTQNGDLLDLQVLELA